MGDKWLNSSCFVGCCFQNQFKIAHNILIESPSIFFYKCIVSVQLVHPYCSSDTAEAWKKSHLILSKRSDFHISNNQSIAGHKFSICILTLFSVDEILLLRCVNWSANIRNINYQKLVQHFIHCTWKSKNSYCDKVLQLSFMY